jgi:hypothetical protein
MQRFITAASRDAPGKLVDDELFHGIMVPHTVTAATRMADVGLAISYAAARKSGFAEKHKAAWAELLANLADWQRTHTLLRPPREQRILIAGWHFPQIPTFFSLARRMRALLLVSQDAPWLSVLKQEGCTLNISNSDAAKTLAREMEAGRIVAAMLDHHHPGTRVESARLLGRTVNTPSGVFELCSRFGYLMAFIAPRGHDIEVVAQIETAGQSPARLAQQYNTLLEAEVRRAPERWLMWQALPVR